MASVVHAVRVFVWSAHGDRHQMSVCGKFSGIDEDDLLRVADRFGIGTAAAVLEKCKVESEKRKVPSHP